jgi:hypothetical protein
MDEGAAVIGKRRQALQDEPLDPLVELVPLGVDRRLMRRAADVRSSPTKCALGPFFTAAVYGR